VLDPDDAKKFILCPPLQNDLEGDEIPWLGAQGGEIPTSEASPKPFRILITSEGLFSFSRSK
jgi:hypothetical protein